MTKSQFIVEIMKMKKEIDEVEKVMETDGFRILARHIDENIKTSEICVKIAKAHAQTICNELKADVIIIITRLLLSVCDWFVIDNCIKKLIELGVKFDKE